MESLPQASLEVITEQGTHAVKDSDIVKMDNDYFDSVQQVNKVSVPVNGICFNNKDCTFKDFS